MRILQEILKASACTLISHHIEEEVIKKHNKSHCPTSRYMQIKSSNNEITPTLTARHFVG
jgi:hypothetical protein